MTDRTDQSRVAAHHVAMLADHLASIVDPPTVDQLVRVLRAAGWTEDPNGRRQWFIADGTPDHALTARVHAEWAAASVTVDLLDFGCPDDVPFDDERDQLYVDADAFVEDVVARLDLAEADPFTIDVHVYYQRVLRRSGHWAVSVAAVQGDPDLPLIVEADFSYGADLPGRLAQLIGPPRPHEPHDWAAVAERIGVEPPPDYRWLMDHHTPDAFGDYLTLVAPQALPLPVPGPLVGLLRYVTASTLPVATTADGAVISYVLEPSDRNEEWGVRVTHPNSPPYDLPVGLLHFLVVNLSAR
jgi:hypothetical protein